MPQPVPQEQAEAQPQESAEEPAYEGDGYVRRRAENRYPAGHHCFRASLAHEVEKKPETPERKVRPGRTCRTRTHKATEESRRHRAKKSAQALKTVSSRTVSPRPVPRFARRQFRQRCAVRHPRFSLKGRTPESWGATRSTLAGSIVIRVSVNRQGHVVGSPIYVGGTGARGCQAYRCAGACIAAARSSRFSVDLDAPAEQVGTITWTFKVKAGILPAVCRDRRLSISIVNY